MRCLASVALPVIQPEKPSASARRGTLIHACIDADYNGHERPDIGRHRFTIDMDALRKKLAGYDEVNFEHAFSFDPKKRTAKRLGKIGRDYPSDGNLHGTSDIDAVSTLTSRGLVADVKTGRLPVVEPKHNAQVKFLATSLVLVTPELTHVVGCIGYLNRDGSWRFVEHEWEVAELHEYARELSWWASKWNDAIELHDAGWPIEPTPSIEACKFCKCDCDKKINAWARGADAPPITEEDAA